MDIFLNALLIFGLRLVDVSLGTLRIVFLVRGRRRYAAAVAFFESLIWVSAVALVITNLDSPLKAIAFAGGYAAGTALGGTIEKWLAIGNRLVRVVSPADSPDAVEKLREEGYAVTVLDGSGRDGEVRVAFSVIPRKKIPGVLNMIREVDEAAFISVEDATLPNNPVIRANAIKK